MKRILCLLIILTMSSSVAIAQDDAYLALLARVGFDNKQVVANPQTQIKETFLKHLKYSNEYDIEHLKSLYSPKYINVDGFDRDTYFKLIKKTWDSYSGIKYSMEIKNITVNGNTAVVELCEKASGTSSSIAEISPLSTGTLESISNSVYYLEKVGTSWVITSDDILDEKTYLKYGVARLSEIEIVSPNQVAAGKDYTSSLYVKAPRGTLVIASIGNEKVTYPQKAAEEVFRKMSDDGLLERVFKSNTDNLNEYSVASVGFTKAEVVNGTEIKVYITGLGFAMSRVNVVPTNKFIEKDDTKKTK